MQPIGDPRVIEFLLFYSLQVYALYFVHNVVWIAIVMCISLFMLVVNNAHIWEKKLLL